MADDLSFVAECTGHDEPTCSVLLTAAGGDIDRAVALHFQAQEARITNSLYETLGTHAGLEP